MKSVSWSLGGQAMWPKLKGKGPSGEGPACDSRSLRMDSVHTRLKGPALTYSRRVDSMRSHPLPYGGLCALWMHLCGRCGCAQHILCFIRGAWRASRGHLHIHLSRIRMATSTLKQRSMFPLKAASPAWPVRTLYCPVRMRPRPKAAVL